MNFINLTPHDITFMTDNREKIKVVEPSGAVSRVNTTNKYCGTLDDIPIIKTEFNEITDLPEPKDDTVYLVSSLVAERTPHRKDVFFPNEIVRLQTGEIIGCRALGTCYKD